MVLPQLFRFRSSSAALAQILGAENDNGNLGKPKQTKENQWESTKKQNIRVPH
jgi:hypothetical protein